MFSSYDKKNNLILIRGLREYEEFKFSLAASVSFGVKIVWMERKNHYVY